MKAKTLLGTLVVIGILVFVIYVWAWPQLKSPVNEGKHNLPPKVQINMPNPSGG
jgi:hypothetical protein